MPDAVRPTAEIAMATPESHVKKVTKKLLDDHKAYHNWPVPMGYGTPFLDCFGCCRGKFFAIETKAPGQTLTPRQGLTKEQVEAAGGKVFVIGEERSYPAGPAVHEFSGMDELEQWLLLS